MPSQTRGAVVLAWCLFGCGAPAKPAPEPWPEANPGGARAPTATSAKAGPVEPWDLGGALAKARVIAPLGPSQHFGGTDGEVLANDEARALQSLAPGARLPTGATAFERHERAGAVFAMVKRPAGFDPEGGDWEYVVVGLDGRVEQRGKLALCARCHAEAPHDHLFGSGRAEAPTVSPGNRAPKP